MRRVVLFLFLGIQINGFAAEWDTIHITYADSVEAFFASAVPKALEQGIISKDLKKKQPATLDFKGSSFPAKIRLKGDWTDHIKPDKWSLRVNLKEGNVYDARKFSLQFPETRGGENERVFHEELKKRDILTTYYTYVHLYVNETYWGVFAFEEHFDEPLLERNDRSGGPLLKFDEDGFWECRQQTTQLTEDMCVEYPIFDASRIRPFGKKKTYGDTVQFARFSSARNVLEDWRNGKIDKNKIDLERFAEYYALCDAFGFYHGLQWHNQRFYYRAADGKIEPVAFDCFSETNELIGKDLLGQFNEQYDTVYFNELWFNYQLFTIPEFTAYYEMCMARYVTEEEWEIKNMPEEVRTRIESRTALIETYNKQMKQSKGRVVPQFYPYEQWKKDHPDLKKKYAIEIPDRPLKSVQLVPVLEGDILSVRNYHPKPLKMIGYQLDSQKVWLTTGYDIAPNETLKFAYGRPKKVYARTSAGDTISSRVDRIAARSDSSEIIGDWRNYFIKEKQDWHWRVDVKNLDKRIELPTGNTFVMDSMEIEFLEHGLIICYGDLEINNSRLESHRRGNVGVRMFGSSLQIKNSTILGFSLSEKDGNSPFQVIGSKVFLLKTVFHDIEAEDAMNLVNCDVTIEDIGLYNCSSDGLDLDFCQGTISKAKLAYCWGDGIDVSYSNLTLSELEISNCGDKGVSVGERSNVKMNGVDISYCGFGIAVKDESIVDIEKSFIQECPTQLIAFRKKEFYKLGGTVYLNDMAIDTDVDEYSKIIYE